MLDFMEGHLARPELMRVLQQAATTVGNDLQAPASRETELILPRKQDDAACFTGLGPLWQRENHVAAYAWSAAGGNRNRPGPCFWWHDGSDRRAAELCITRGMPPRVGASAFVLAGWEAHGWRPHDPRDYLRAAQNPDAAGEESKRR